MAPRQWMRKLKVGKTGFAEAYRAVREMRDRYPDKAVTFFAQQYPTYGWAILMAGGSLPNVPLDGQADQLPRDLAQMRPVGGEGCVALGQEGVGYLVYTLGHSVSLKVEEGRYAVYTINATTGEVKIMQKKTTLKGVFGVADGGAGRIYWLRRL